MEDLVIDPGGRDLGAGLAIGTTVRRLAIKKNFRALGYPVITFPGDVGDPLKLCMQPRRSPSMLDLSSWTISIRRRSIHCWSCARISTLIHKNRSRFNRAFTRSTLLKLESPVLVTTNFSITYFSVANEVEGSGLPAWLFVTDAEGMSVLTAWAAGKFDAESIAKAVKGFNIADKVSRKRIVLPGHVAVFLASWKVNCPIGRSGLVHAKPLTCPPL